MPIEDYQEEIEKIFKGETMIVCDIPRRYCEMRGEYYRCYSIDLSEKCQIYNHYKVRQHNRNI